MPKSPIDDLFFELFGFYPNKAGHAYELLVAAALRAITGKEIPFDEHVRGIYSQTDYQVDSIVADEDSKKMVEVKDYTIDARKVGRGDIQKLQGALTDLPFDKGMFASATEYTKPAKKYSEATKANPLQKSIDLYHVRASTDADEAGRIKKFIINMVMVLADYQNGDLKFAWTDDAIRLFEKRDLLNKPLNFGLDTFYDANGNIDCTLEEFTLANQPLHTDIEDEVANGCWLLHGKYVRFQDDFYELKGISYSIPYVRVKHTFTVEAEGTPRVLIKSEDGTVDKLLTDEELKKITFKDGKAI